MVEFDLKEKFIKENIGFEFLETISYSNNGKSFVFANGKDVVIIDEGICTPSSDGICFAYSLLTRTQNKYMHEYARVFRFLGYDREEVRACLDSDGVELSADLQSKRILDRNSFAEPSPLEKEFEDIFAETYGMSALSSLSKEYNIEDDAGKNFYLDYIVRTKEQTFAIELNGRTYHHPQVLGEEGYRNQLHKQNMTTLWGMKLYRFSFEDCAVRNQIMDDLRTYIGKDASAFIDSGLSVERKFALYEHQTLSLEEIEKKRKEGLKAFLVVLPTGSGKSMVVEEDLKNFAQGKENFKALILVPGINTKIDWLERVSKYPELAGKVDVFTYAYMSIHYHELAQDYYNYLVVDEAHHAVAPVLKRVIQYFDTDFTIGLTATDQRPDKLKLETVFGSYTTSLSLLEAMEKGIVAMANVFRIETNIDLSKIRFNGKDYVNADLEKTIRVTSRNELIVDVIRNYFTEGEAAEKQGVIFCVNVKHCQEMAKLMNEAGIRTESYTRDTHDVDAVMEGFKKKDIRFLCACNMISEGWDYPELGILVMARPTLSKVLYLQQIGRGLRKTDRKKNVFVIDVVDEYGSMARACSMHAIFNNGFYVPWGNITRTYKPGEWVEVDGIREHVEKIVPVDVSTFEDKYGDYLNSEQLARDYFVSTGTVLSWIRKGKLKPSTSFTFGSKKIHLFSPEDAKKYRVELGIKEHTDETIKEDFFAFIEERDYTLSYKFPFMLNLLKCMDDEGNAPIDAVLDGYISFYLDRIKRGLTVDRATCPYNAETLQDRKLIRRSMLDNPFEKFERKRFMYQSKDLGIISWNHALFSKMTDTDWLRVKEQFEEDMKNYFEEL